MILYELEVTYSTNIHNGVSNVTYFFRWYFRTKMTCPTFASMQFQFVENKKFFMEKINSEVENQD